LKLMVLSHPLYSSRKVHLSSITRSSTSFFGLALIFLASSLEVNCGLLNAEINSSVYDVIYE